MLAALLFARLHYVFIAAERRNNYITSRERQTESEIFLLSTCMATVPFHHEKKREREP